MPINWPMPMGDGNRGWGAMAGRGGVGGQTSWPQPAGAYQTSTSGGYKSPESGFGGGGNGMSNPATGPNGGSFTPPSGGPASQWGGAAQAPPVTYGAAAPGSQQFTYQPPSQQTGYATPEQSALYQQALGSRQTPMAPTAGPMGMLGGMNAQQLQSILPMLQQLFASRGATAQPTGQTGYATPEQQAMYQVVAGGMPPESSPVVPPGQGQVGYANAGQSAIYQQAMANPYRQAPMARGSYPSEDSGGQVGYANQGQSDMYQQALMSGRNGALLSRRTNLGYQ